MIGLWTRAAQARCLCNCSACVAATGRLAQRTAQIPIRRRIGRPDTFTVFSSTLVFSAAVTDGMRKDRKMQNWDKIIEETKAEIEAVEQEQRSRLERMAVVTLDENNNSGLPSVAERAWLAQTTWVEMLEWAEIQEKQRDIDGFHEWKGIQLNMLQNLKEDDLRKLLLDKKILHRFYAGSDCSSLESVPYTHVYSTQKLRTLEWSMLKLVVRLLSHTALSSSTDENTQHDTARFIHGLVPLVNLTWEHTLDDVENFNGRLQQLQSEPKESDLYSKFPSPYSLRYRHSPSERGDQLMDFNLQLQDLLDSISSLTAKNISRVCTALLESTIAPDIHTYNLLLVKFCQLRAKPPVAAAFESLRETHMRPNEITHATLLRYFSITNNKTEFLLYIQRMNGFKRGLTLADPDRPIDALAVSRYRYFGTGKVRIAELARMNSEVYTCIIKGLLEMFQFSEAAWYYANMAREGWKPTLELLTALLKHCNETLDVVSGWRIWTTMLESCQVGQQISRSAYEIMLELCKQCDKPRLYGWVVQDGQNCGVLPKEVAKVPQTESDTRRHELETTSVVATAVGHTITVTELRDRFPYLPIGMIREMLRNASASSCDNPAPILDSACTDKIIYKTMKQALLKTSFANARSYIENHILMPKSLRQAMLHEASWVFQLQKELSNLSQTFEGNVRTQACGETIGQPLKTMRDDCVVRTEEINHVFPSIPGETVHSSLLAEIKAVDSKIAPKVVSKAYHDFRRAAREQQSTTKRTPTISVKSWSSNNILSRDAGEPWMQEPHQRLEVEAG